MKHFVEHKFSVLTMAAALLISGCTGEEGRAASSTPASSSQAVHSSSSSAPASSAMSSAQSSSSSSIASSSSSAASSSSEPAVAVCNNPRPQPTRVNWRDNGSPLTGPYQVTVELPTNLNSHTVFRPTTLDMEDFPIVVWGNGGCSNNANDQAEYIAQIASQGYFVIVSGRPGGGGGDFPQNGSTNTSALDWAEDENQDSCSPYYDQLNEQKMAVAGWSCGGLMALNVGNDPRLSAVMALNSGLFQADFNLFTSFHTPIVYFNGGPGDVAYPNGVRDYRDINSVPVYHANLPVGHGGTYTQDNGGEFARVTTAWLNWLLKDDESASGRGMFFGPNCGICNTNWTIEHKGFQ